MKKLETKQDLFEASVTHIIHQGHRSMAGDFTCAYVDSQGGGCAFGGIFPSEARAEILATESNPPIRVLIRQAKEVYPTLFQFFSDNPVFKDENFIFFGHVQNLHDRARNWDSKSNMVHSISEVAATHSLDTSFLDSLDWAKFEENTHLAREVDSWNLQ